MDVSNPFALRQISLWHVQISCLPSKPPIERIHWGFVDQYTGKLGSSRVSWAPDPRRPRANAYDLGWFCQWAS